MIASRRALLCALLAALPVAARSAAPDAPIIVTAPGGDADSDDAVRLAGEDLDLGSGPDVLRAVSVQVAGVSLSDAQGNSYQPSLVYRGFSASALQGNAQGLAVFLDGGRFNLPFGDTVNFDLLPNAAIDSVSLRDSNPVYGLNGLGGAVVIATHTGRSAPGTSAEIGLGDHGRRQATASFGTSHGAFSLFAAGAAQRDGGWRAYSPSTLYHGFLDAGWDGARAGLHLKTLAADTQLTGNGAAPVDLLATDRAAVFTHPDRTDNRLLRASLHPWIAVDDESRVEASLYVQSLRQRTKNGDLAEIAPCVDMPGLLCLGETAPQARLRDLSGMVLPVRAGIDDYAVFNRTRTRSTSGGAVIQYVRQAELLGMPHKLTLGLTHDRAKSRFGAQTELGALEEDRAVVGLGPILRQADGAIAPIDLAVRTRTTGLLLWDAVQITPRLTAELGIRWTGAALWLEDQLGTALNGRHHFRRVNPGVEFDYTLSSQLAVRLGYAETSRAPTPAELSCADAAAPCSLTNFFVADPPLDQVVARTWEAGVQGAWEIAGWKGDWSLSLYRAGIANDLLLTAAETRGRAFFQNIGQSRRQGVDAQWSAQRGPWALRLGYAYVQAQFRSGFTITSPDNPAAGEDGRLEVTAGARLPGIPAHRGVASVVYSADRVTVRASAHVQSHQLRMGDESNRDEPVPGYARVDLAAAIDIRPGLSAFADVTNVFNQRYASFGTYAAIGAIRLDEAPNAADPRANTPGAPRRVLMGLRLRR